MNLHQKHFIAGILIFILGLSIGFTGGWYKFVKGPLIQAEKVAKEQQERLHSMVRSGEIREVQTDAVTIKVEKGGGDIGKTMKYRTNEYTKIQIGMGFIPEQKVDLTKWFKSGEYVNLMVSDGQAVLVHRELRAEEQG